MVQRSFSPCFFGNKVTMAFKLIFVFAIIAIFAVDALDIKNCGNYQLKGRKFAKRNGRLTAELRVAWGTFKPMKYEMKDSRGNNVAGGRLQCNGLTQFVKPKNGGRISCGKGNWIPVTFNNRNLAKEPGSKHTLRIYGSNNKVLGCFAIDD